jgi:hypothetical protein
MKAIKKAQNGVKKTSLEDKRATEMFNAAGKIKKPAVKKLPSDINKAFPKAKDGKWIQKAVNPAHKGFCTPMTKATCTPRRKALAKTFKAMAKKRK